MKYAVKQSEDAKTVLIARLFHEAKERGLIQEGKKYQFDPTRSVFVEDSPTSTSSS
jgi:hypothetical protein